jgi:hypothetical protein
VVVRRTATARDAPSEARKAIVTTDAVRELLDAFAVDDDRDPREKLGLVIAAAARVIEEALLGVGRHDDRLVLEALDGLVADMRRNIRERCANHHARLLEKR